ncbi:MAG: ATP-binding protein [Sphingobacteriaceae bacterium]|jgi:predicted AAA+ superfamily ATPase|nr:ATP-binding protein [Sphingobacteriaceae bacterium]
MIKRLLEKDIARLCRQYPAVAILGARQVGKTTLAKKIASSQSRKMLYLDLENPIDLRKLQDAYSFFADNHDKCIVIDEIQVRPELFSILRSAIDSDRKNGRFILLGSASPQLIKGVSESLAGRIAYRDLNPVFLNELPSKISQNKHWLRGGFPNALLARTDPIYLEWATNFIRSYIERDLSAIFHIEFTTSTLRRLLQMLAHVSGQLWNAEMVGRSLGITAPTVNRYVDYLEAAFIVRRLQPYATNTRKRLVKAPKVFIRDSGVLHGLLLLGNHTQLMGHPNAGNSWEGYVTEQIICAMPAGTEAFFYRTQAGAECDLVLVKGIAVIAAIEIKLSNAPVISKGFYNSIEDLKPKRAFILVPNTDSYKTKDGIEISSVQNFAVNILPKL